jgi:hypothetical protein
MCAMDKRIIKSLASRNGFTALFHRTGAVSLLDESKTIPAKHNKYPRHRRLVFATLEDANKFLKQLEENHVRQSESKTYAIYF